MRPYNPLLGYFGCSKQPKYYLFFFNKLCLLILSARAWYNVIMKGLTITNHQSPTTKCAHRVQRTHAVTIFICFLLLCSVDLPYAQTGLQGMRLPFRASADTTMDRFQTFDLNSPVFGVNQIMEGTLSDSYIVGPGDGFLITVWGKRVDSFQTTVTPEGKLFIPQIAEIPVAGLTLAALQDTLTTEIGKFFFDVRVSATLVRLRRFQVYVLGGVLTPGPYPAHAVKRTQELIGQAGGLLDEASVRNIQIKRHGQVVETADLLRFNRKGDIRFNPYVQDGDMIFVPLKTDSITVQGAVWAPGGYEFRKDDTMTTLIKLAQGFRPEAYQREVELVRFNDDGVTTSTSVLDLSDATDMAWRMPLRPDDQVFVRAVPRWHETLQVSITGEIRYPGLYAIERKATRLTEIIEKAGGITEEASLLESFIVRADTARIVDTEYERLKEVPIQEMNPEEYAFFKMKAREQRGLMSIDFHRLLQENDPAEDVILKNGDEIVIAIDRETVLVSGAVASPGAIVYNSAFTITDYIERAGGYGWNARKGKTRVIKAKTGDRIKAKNVKQLGPGDTIWVPEKPYRDWWSLFLQGLSTAGQIATISLGVDTVSK